MDPQLFLNTQRNRQRCSTDGSAGRQGFGVELDDLSIDASASIEKFSHVTIETLLAGQPHLCNSSRNFVSRFKHGLNIVRFLLMVFNK